MRINRDIYGAGLSHRAVAVYIYLCDRTGPDGSCFPSHATIAADLRLSVSTVKRALGDLERARCLEKQARYHPRGGRTSNLYRL